jgi:hypothetical protein
MSGRSFSFGNSGHPLAQALSLVVLGVVLVGAVIMGVFVLMALLGLGVLGFLGYKLRGWWLNRGAGSSPDGRGPGPGRPAKGIRYIEGEYEVLDADADAERRRSGDPH